MAQAVLVKFLILATSIILVNGFTFNIKHLYQRNYLKRPVQVGVLLLNLGGPAKAEDIEGFLFNLFDDPDVTRLPAFFSFMQHPIAHFISKQLLHTAKEAYQTIGGGSPILKYTQAQANLIEQSLRRRATDGTDFKCYFAMRYWNPYTEEVLEKMQQDGVNTVVIVPLYPQYSISTSGSSLRLLQDIFYKQPEKWGPNKVTHTVVPAWYYRDGYVKAMASLIIKELESYSVEEMKKGVHVLFSAHGVPESYIEAGDPYQQQIEDCVQLISKEVSRQLLDSRCQPRSIPVDVASALAQDIEHNMRLFVPSANGRRSSGTGPALRSRSISTPTSSSIKALQFHLSFQSRVGPVQWLKPYTEHMLEKLGHSGVENLIVVPVSFVSEHIETLQEIDRKYKDLAIKCGINNWRRVPALNTNDRFISDMADMVIEALKQPALSVAEAASQKFVFQYLSEKSPSFHHKH